MINVFDFANQFFSWYRLLDNSTNPMIPISNHSLDKAVKSVIDSGKVDKQIADFLHTKRKITPYVIK